MAIIGPIFSPYPIWGHAIILTAFKRWRSFDDFLHEAMADLSFHTKARGTRGTNQNGRLMERSTGLLMEGQIRMVD
jgi:hypothetical protein